MVIKEVKDQMEKRTNALCEEGQVKHHLPGNYELCSLQYQDHHSPTL